MNALTASDIRILIACARILAICAVVSTTLLFYIFTVVCLKDFSGKRKGREGSNLNRIPAKAKGREEGARPIAHNDSIAGQPTLVNPQETIVL